MQREERELLALLRQQTQEWGLMCGNINEGSKVVEAFVALYTKALLDFARDQQPGATQ